MKIAVFGAGYVGLVSAACFARMGHDVSVIDVDAERVARLDAGETPIHEEGLSALLAEGREGGRLRFFASAAEGTEGADVALLAVGTPSDPSSGAADMRQTDEAAAAVATHAKDGLVVVTKSTVPIGTAKRLAAYFKRARPDIHIHVASNPEFLREGQAVKDFLHPDRIVVGCDTDEARRACVEMYLPLTEQGYPLKIYSTASAETVKYAANGFLAVKIAYINEIADLCERTGASALEVAEGMGLDARIGPAFLRPGPGYGGSCFPKDTQALSVQAMEHGTELRIVDAAVEANARRLHTLVRNLRELLRPLPLGEASFGVLGAAFKAGTDDVRDSPALRVVRYLLVLGARVRLYDPAAMDNARRELAGFNGLSFADGWREAVTGTDAAIVATEWPEFSGIDVSELRGLLREGGRIYDMRNMLSGEGAGEGAYRGIGRKAESN